MGKRNQLYLTNDIGNKRIYTPYTFNRKRGITMTERDYDNLLEAQCTCWQIKQELSETTMDRWDVRCEEVKMDNSQKYQIWLNGVTVGEVANIFDAVEKLRGLIESQAENARLTELVQVQREYIKWYQNKPHEDAEMLGYIIEGFDLFLKIKELEGV